MSRWAPEPPNCVCLQCGAAFHTKPSRIASGKGKFCSRSCSLAAQPRGVGSRPRLSGRSGPIPRPAVERAQRRLTRNEFGCAMWSGATVNGYGVIGRDNRPNRWIYLHRLMWEAAYGPIPDGLFVCHRCDVNYPPKDITYRRCCEPTHLFLGTNADNMADKIAKGRA